MYPSRIRSYHLLFPCEHLDGDFNLPDIKWTCLEVNFYSNRSIRLVNDNNLNQNVKEPTSVPNIFDLVLSTEGQLEQLVTGK